MKIDMKYAIQLNFKNERSKSRLDGIATSLGRNKKAERKQKSWRKIRRIELTNELDHTINIF